MTTRRPPRTRSTLALVALILGFLTMGGPGSSWAHTSVRRTTPGPTERVHGLVDEITIEFFDPIGDAVITVERPSGSAQPLRGPSSLDEVATTLRVPIEALTEAGDHVVTVEFRTADGDHQTHVFSFEYAPGATGGGGRVGIVAGVAAGGLAAMAAVALAWRRRRPGAGTGALHFPSR